MKQLQGCLVFGMAMAVLFLLYLPAAKAGFVTDFTGWLDQVRNHSFREYINRSNFHVKSLYQFTQLVTYGFYKLFGTNRWWWHMLFIGLHATNVALLFTFFSRLLSDAGVAKGNTIALNGAMLFCISPYMSEVIVWEPAFHFLSGLLFILLILLAVQQYLRSGEGKHIWIAGVLYFLSTFSLEVFYVTPWLVLALGLYYQHSRVQDKRAFQKIVRFFFLPMILLFALRLIIFYAAYGSWVSRIGTGAVTSITLQSFGKPAKYLFHLLLSGRFFPPETRQRVYSFCDSTAGVFLFYVLVSAAVALIVIRYKNMIGNARIASLAFIYVLITLALLIPIWFGNSLLVLYDRYVYFAAAFFYMLFAIVVSMIPNRNVRVVILLVFTLVNLRFTIIVSRYWGKSERIIYGLLHDMPEAGNKTIVLLNLPESMNGVAMIGSGGDSEYKLMHNLLMPWKPINNTVYDVLSYNMTTPDDGAHVTVANDSVIHVTLNQWGTWWWYEGKGGHSYETADYKLNLTDAGHWYELTLKKPASQYLLLYTVGDKWKPVDMGKKNADQN